MPEPQKTQVARAGNFDDIPLYALADGTRGDAYIGDGAPDPSKVNFWIDTSGISPIPRFWNGSTWKAPGGTPFLYDQPSAQQVWTVNHNFGYWPHVHVWDRFGRRLRPGIDNVDLNTVEVHHSYLVAGSALLE